MCRDNKLSWDIYRANNPLLHLRNLPMDSLQNGPINGEADKHSWKAANWIKNADGSFALQWKTHKTLQ